MKLNLTTEEFKDLAYFKALCPDTDKYYKYFNKNDIIKLRNNSKLAKAYFDSDFLSKFNEEELKDFLSHLYYKNSEWKITVKEIKKQAEIAYKYAQLKDKDFKKNMTKKYGKSKNTLCADYEKIINGVTYVFEYENSSRGLTSNLIKILRKSKGKKIKILFVRTLTHEYSHNQDYENLQYIGKNLILENIEIFETWGWNFIPTKKLEDNFKKNQKIEYKKVVP